MYVKKMTPTESEKARLPTEDTGATYDADDSDSDTVSLDPGEKALLLNAFEEELPVSDSEKQISYERSLSFSNVLIKLDGAQETDSFLSDYGHPVSVEDAAKRMPLGGNGFVWKAQIVPDDYLVDGKILPHLNEGDFDHSNDRSIKPLRPSLPVTASDLFSSLTKIDGEDGPRWIFNGVLNGWPSLRCFELLCLERKRQGPAPRKMFGKKWQSHWRYDNEGRRGQEPSIPSGTKQPFRALLKSPSWSASGWSPDSPGFAFWYEKQHPEKPRLTYGTNMIETVGNDVCTFVHMVSHRYAVNRETAKDKLTYHSLVLLEWDHGEYCTVVEEAYLNGIGGYKGKCNWYHDKDEPVTELYRSIPPEMIAPWLSTHSEIRCYDVGVKNLEEFKSFIEHYEGTRFLDAHYTFSHCARLTYRTKSHIAQYLLNYIRRDCSYHELRRNCQTMAADFCSFLAGKKDVEPFHPVNRIQYRNQNHLFLYDSTMYND